MCSSCEITSSLSGLRCHSGGTWARPLSQARNPHSQLSPCIGLLGGCNTVPLKQQKYMVWGPEGRDPGVGRAASLGGHEGGSAGGLPPPSGAFGTPELADAPALPAHVSPWAFQHPPSVRVCVQASPSYQDPRDTGSRPTLMTSFQFDDLRKDHISK